MGSIYQVISVFASYSYYPSNLPLGLKIDALTFTVRKQAIAATSIRACNLCSLIQVIPD
jgi:hypothetical protein